MKLLSLAYLVCLWLLVGMFVVASCLAGVEYWRTLRW
jgi:hypothetical protein